jgi:hypothetical protein
MNYLVDIQITDTRATKKKKLNWRRKNQRRADEMNLHTDRLSAVILNGNGR